eukprot:TRINITY_DN32451_c0_g1_i1.p1 TRINITY_DN32451_c0_g1~~TRINITY_DN32451_c0_g1_i1.p1  ORF type:complete len:482 (-),score=97.47 TRINITY_DN32451_c0_g1_i1:19-1464(-)
MASATGIPDRKRVEVPAPIAVPEISDKNERVRQKVIAEIINTEQDFVRNLKLMQVYFVEPLKEQRSVIIPKSDVDLMFSNLGELLKIQEKFLADLMETAKKAKGGPIQLISHNFSKLSPHLGPYADFMINQDTALATIDKCKAIPTFEAFLEQNFNEPELKQLTLFSYLIMPCQRICKYPLLLRELSKVTDSKHADYPALQKAIVEIGAKAEKVNEAKRFSEKHEEVLAHLQSVEGTEALSLSSKKDRVFDSEFSQIPLVIEGKAVSSSLWIFNDIILFAIPNKRHQKMYPLTLVAAIQPKRAMYRTSTAQCDGVEEKVLHLEDTYDNSQVTIAIRSEVAFLEEKLTKLVKKAMRTSASMYEETPPSSPQRYTLDLNKSQHSKLKKSIEHDKRKSQIFSKRKRTTVIADSKPTTTSVPATRQKPFTPGVHATPGGDNVAVAVSPSVKAKCSKNVINAQTATNDLEVVSIKSPSSKAASRRF